MGVLESIKNFVTKKENKNTSSNSNTNIWKTVVYQQQLRFTSDIDEWKMAVRESENANNPKRVRLCKVIDDIRIDTHLSSCISTLQNGLIAKEFAFFNNDKIDLEATSLLKAEWFKEFLSSCLDSFLYGYSVCQFGEIVDGKYSYVKKFPQRNVLPESESILIDISSNKTVSLKTKNVSNWVMGIGDPYYNLGLLNKCIPIIIYKKLAMSCWSQYVELFGAPFRHLKTDIKDEQRRYNAEEMMRNMGSLGWAVSDKDDDLNFINFTNAGESDVYENLISLCNSEISKLIIGQTMTSENGSSRSQAQVHKEVLDLYIKSYANSIEDIVNYYLVPFMQNHGLLKSNPEFRFTDKKNINPIEIIKAVSLWNGIYEFDEAELSEMFGMSIVKSTNPIDKPTNKIKQADKSAVTIGANEPKNFFLTSNNNRIEYILNSFDYEKGTEFELAIENGVSSIRVKNTKGFYEDSKYLFDKELYNLDSAKSWLKKYNLI